MSCRMLYESLRLFHIGLEGRVYVMNLPCSGTYKFVKLFQFELPRTVDQLGHLTKTVVRFLHLKVPSVCTSE